MRKIPVNVGGDINCELFTQEQTLQTDTGTLREKAEFAHGVFRDDLLLAFTKTRFQDSPHP